MNWIEFEINLTFSSCLQGGEAKGSVNGVEVFDWINIPTVLPHHGWIAIGTPDYSAAQFDNFAIHSAS